MNTTEIVLFNLNHICLIHKSNLLQIFLLIKERKSAHRFTYFQKYYGYIEFIEEEKKEDKDILQLS